MTGPNNNARGNIFGNTAVDISNTIVVISDVLRNIVRSPHNSLNGMCLKFHPLALIVKAALPYMPVKSDNA